MTDEHYRELKMLLQALDTRIKAREEAEERIEGKIDELQRQLNEIRSELVVLRRWRAEEDANQPQTASNVVTTVEPAFKGLTTSEALETVASENGGVIVAKHAVKRLLKAGFLSPNIGHPTSTVYAALSRGVKAKRWRKAEPGVYELVRRMEDNDRQQPFALQQAS